MFRRLSLGMGLGPGLSWPWPQLLADPGLHTHAHDPLVFVPALAVVVGASAFAALMPLLRALRMGPAVALRYE